RDVEEALDAMAPGLAGINMDAHVFRPASYMTTALRNLGVVGLVSALLLVVSVGLLFTSWRVVVIPLLAVPLSLVSAAWVLHLRGETLTTMTLLGLAAAAVVVVDDVVGDVAAIRTRQLAAGPETPPLSSVMGGLGSGGGVAVARIRTRQLPSGPDTPPLSSVMGDLVSARRGPLLVAFVMAVLVL